DGGRLGELVGITGHRDLAGRCLHRSAGTAEVDASGPATEGGERVPELVGPLGEELLAVVGEGHQPSTAVAGGDDQAFVLELRDRGIDRSSAGTPGVPGAFGDRLHQLVTVHRLVGQQQQDRCPDVTALGAATPFATAVARTTGPTSVTVRPASPPARTPTRTVGSGRDRGSVMAGRGRGTVMAGRARRWAVGPIRAVLVEPGIVRAVVSRTVTPRAGSSGPTSGTVTSRTTTAGTATTRASRTTRAGATRFAERVGAGDRGRIGCVR